MAGWPTGLVDSTPRRQASRQGTMEVIASLARFDLAYRQFRSIGVRFVGWARITFERAIGARWSGPRWRSAAPMLRGTEASKSSVWQIRSSSVRSSFPIELLTAAMFPPATGRGRPSDREPRHQANATAATGFLYVRALLPPSWPAAVR